MNKKQTEKEKEHHATSTRPDVAALPSNLHAQDVSGTTGLATLLSARLLPTDTLSRKTELNLKGTKRTLTRIIKDFN